MTEEHNTPGENPNRLINCGECTVQKNYRVSMRADCVRHSISIGDLVEVFIKIVPQEPEHDRGEKQ